MNKIVTQQIKNKRKNVVVKILLKYNNKTKEKSLDSSSKDQTINFDNNLFDFSFDELLSLSIDEPISKKRTKKSIKKTSKKTKTIIAKTKQKTIRKRALEKNLGKFDNCLMRT